MFTLIFRILAPFLLPLAAQATSDHIVLVTIPVPGPQGASTMARAAADMHTVFQNFRPGIDAQSRIVKPLAVTGSAAEPEVTVSVEKCVAIFCRTVDFDALVSMREVSGPCEANFDFEIDLSRSSEILSSVYDQLSGDACYQSNRADGSGTLTLNVSVHRAPGYAAGSMQRRILTLIEMQVGPISEAFGAAFRQTP